VYDLKNQVWRARELSREPLPMSALRFSNEQEAEANQLLKEAEIKAHVEKSVKGSSLKGTMKHKGKVFKMEAFIDPDARLVRASCDCNFFKQNKLRKGPCSCILALRMAKAKETYKF